MDERQLTTLLAQLVGVTSAQRQLLEVLYTRELVSQADPAASCDELAGYMRSMKIVPESAENPAMQRVVAQQAQAEIERHFAAVRRQLADSLGRRAS